MTPVVDAGVVRLAPCLPDGTELEVHGIELGDGHLAVRARGSDVEVLEAPDGLEVLIS